MKFRNTRILNHLGRIQIINYFTDPINIVLGLVLTSVTMLCGIAFKPTNDGFPTDPFILASAIGISVIRNSQYNLNLTISDGREKRFFAKLTNTSISRFLLAFSILAFNLFINFFVAGILFGLAMCFSSQRLALQNVEWGAFVVGFLLNILLSNFMAFLGNILFKKKDLVLVVSLLSYFGPMYLLGLGIPGNVVGNYKGLNIFLYLFPHRYPLAIMQAAWAGTAHDMSFPLITNTPGGGGVAPNSWLGQHGFGYGTLGWGVPAVATLVGTLLFAFCTLAIVNYRYNYGLRRYKDYSGVQVHLRYINEIKRTKSIEELNALVRYINSNNNYEIPEVETASKTLKRHPRTTKTKKPTKESR